MGDLDSLLAEVQKYDTAYNNAVREVNILQHEMKGAGPTERDKLKAKIASLEIKIKDFDKKEKDAREKLNAYKRKK
jgi:predicted  nucleic acid-binding Zn-ribbon protein